MTTAARPPLRKPAKPFYFNTSEHLVRIERDRALTLPEFLQALRECPEGSIFQHTFRTLQEHHFIRQGFSNDFAHWSLSACHEPVLAEQLASVDVREFTSIAGLRARMVDIVEQFLEEYPRAASLPKFIDGLRQVSVHSIHHHFIEARLRLRRMSNDFSQWLEAELGLKETAQAIERIDIYTNTMEGVRQQIIRIVQQAAN
jgi:Family of unknown function (DUF5752)